MRNLVIHKLKGRQLKPTEGRKPRRQAYLEGKKIGSLEGKPFTLNSLSSNPPTLLSSNNHSGGNAMLIPPYGLLSSDKPLTLTRKGRGQCASPFTLHHYLKRNAAFTLAEVLITLGIIGIVAALTMPALIANYQKKQTVVQLKKAYTTLSQAVKLSELENGEIKYWDLSLSSDDFFEKYLSHFLTLNNSNIQLQNLQYKYLSGGACVDDVCTENSFIAFLSDGSMLIISRNSGGGKRAFAIDINGLKNPNIVGKDLFIFWITQNNGLAPFGYSNTIFADGSGTSQTFGIEYDRHTLTGNNTHACAKGKKGFWCTALIMMDGWEIKDDYPW